MAATSASTPCFSLVAALLFPGLHGCALDARSEPQLTPENSASKPPDVRGASFTFEIATWNLKQFPIAGQDTVDRVASMIEKLQLDIIAVQELADTEAFDQLARGISGWQSVAAMRWNDGMSGGNYNPPVGFLYDSASIEVTGKYLLFLDDTVAFPRSPLVLEVLWHGVPLTVIDVHLKAMGDGILDTSNLADEEMRRKVACDRLAHYIGTELAGRRVIVLGDLNDRIEEAPPNNVFQTFIDRPDRFYFADWSLLDQGGFASFSYPHYASNIDHILITSELYPAFFNPGADVQAIGVEGFLASGWAEYQALVSDHRPVYMRLALDVPPQALDVRPSISLEHQSSR